MAGLVWRGLWIDGRGGGCMCSRAAACFVLCVSVSVCPGLWTWRRVAQQINPLRQHLNPSSMHKGLGFRV